jgi:hypothetical protein
LESPAESSLSLEACMHERPSKKSKSFDIMDINQLLDARHASGWEDMETTADASYPRTEISELMESPCRPETNGYFGATYGFPSKIKYEFELESRQGTDIDEVLMIIDEHVMDVVLSKTFPSICSYDGTGNAAVLEKSNEIAITGFKFTKDELDMGRK